MVDELRSGDAALKKLEELWSEVVALRRRLYELYGDRERLYQENAELLRENMRLGATLRHYQPGAAPLQHFEEG